MTISKPNVPFRRICMIVLDSLGVGELPDASRYGDQGSNTLLHTLQKLKGLKIRNLEELGLLEILESRNTTRKVKGFFGRMREKSNGKDTATGHWEMMGLVLEKPFDTFLSGFPSELMEAWKERVGQDFLGNKPASGTVIIEELGEEHLKTKKPIVYTSADSVFQIAAHEEVFGLQSLYGLCQKTREFLSNSPYQVGRVIARPFLGRPGSFKRTQNRKDYALSPFAETALDKLKFHKISTVGIGKIPSIYNYQGLSKTLEAHNDDEALEATIKALQNENQPGLIFTNLNDLDMIYGHRRNVEGYGRQIEHIDSRLGPLLNLLHKDDLLIITADHGNDPTFKGTDHTREYVPLLLSSPRFKAAPAPSRRLPDRTTFADIGQTLCENFQLEPLSEGTSILKDLIG